MVVLSKRAALLSMLALAACKPDLAGRASLVQSTRILAVQSEPAEAEPRDAVTYTALVVDPNSDAPAVTLDWAYCNARKALAELGPVNPLCLSLTGDFLVPLGQGTQVSGKIPDAACRSFGPEVPQAKPGEPYGRPVDPDTTGGYYQPLRVVIPGTESDTTIATSRISCGVANASSSDVIEYRKNYHANTNPKVAVDGAPLAPIAQGAHVTLRAIWPGSTEPYVYYDFEAQAVVPRRESMRVSWFATAGSFDVDRTGRGEDEMDEFSENGFTAPNAPGVVRGWIVLRDDRGGAGWTAFTLQVP